MLTPESIRRNAFLHEAGHAVVAHELGLIVREVRCDGEEGHCRADYSQVENDLLEQTHRRNLPIATGAALQEVIGAFAKKLCTMMGGIAGESLEAGRAVIATRRASDDFAAFFGFLATVSRGLRSEESHPIWLQAYTSAQDEAWRIVHLRESKVRSIAAALEPSHHLDEHEFAKLIAGS